MMDTFKVQLGARYQFALIHDDGRADLVPVTGFVFADMDLCSMPDVKTASGANWDTPDCYRALVLPDGRALDLFGEELAGLDEYMLHLGLPVSLQATNNVHPLRKRG
jgi:hypothetical protein